MALIKCSECGKEISDKAEICVNCGNPIQKIINSEKNKYRKNFYELSKNERRELVNIMKSEGLYHDGLISVLSIFNILFGIGLISSFVVLLISMFNNETACYCMIVCFIYFVISISIENVYGTNKIKRYYNDNVDLVLVSREKNLKKKLIEKKKIIIEILTFIFLIIVIIVIIISIFSFFNKELKYDVGYFNVQNGDDFTYTYIYTFRSNNYFNLVEQVTDNKSMLQEIESNGIKDGYLQELFNKYTKANKISGTFYINKNKIHLQEYGTKKEYECLIIKNNEIKCNNKIYTFDIK